MDGTTDESLQEMFDEFDVIMKMHFDKIDASLAQLKKTFKGEE